MSITITLLETAKSTAESIHMDDTTFQMYVDLIAPLLAVDNYGAARDLYREVVETYGYVVIADGIYSEARKKAETLQ